MVNVGGRSKGCSTCRKRRVKCDETRPICQRCQRQNLECNGPQETQFIQATIIPSRRKLPPPPPQQPPSPKPNFQILINPLECYITFTRTHLSPQGPIDSALQQLHSSPSSPSTSTTPHQTIHLAAAKSFATLFFGTQHHHPGITTQGLAHHGTTLRSLNSLLTQPQCWNNNALLVSITTLAIQESMIPTGGTQGLLYLQHMRGLDRLLSLRNPRANLSRESLALYKCLRYLVLFAALCMGRACVFAGSEWGDVLRGGCADSGESREQEVCDVLAGCSVLVEEVGSGRGNVADRAGVLRERLLSWRMGWDGDEEGKGRGSVEEREEEEGREKEEGYSDIQFEKSSSLLLLILWNVARIYVLKILVGVQEGDRKLEYEVEKRAAVIELCRILPGDSSKDQDVHASPIVAWALHVALEELKGDESREGRVLLDIVNWKGVGGIAQGLRPS